MKNTPFLVLALLLAPSIAFAGEINPFSPDTPLTANEQAGVSLSQKWMDNKQQPITDGSGRVTYFYGQSLPSVVCSPVRTCVIELQVGEVINQGGLQAGDTVRWRVTPTVSGQGDKKRTNLIVKPSDAGMETTLTVVTNKRVYQIKLISRLEDWMPFVNFDYPEALEWEYAQYHAAMAEQARVNTLPDGQSTPELDFNYVVSGKADFKPLRVYNNGSKTIIEMPPTVEHKSLPTVLVVNGDQQELVNYRYRNSTKQDGRRINGRFIVDQLSQELVLVSGVGSDQETILIKRKRG